MKISLMKPFKGLKLLLNWPSLKPRADQTGIPFHVHFLKETTCQLGFKENNVYHMQCLYDIYNLMS